MANPGPNPNTNPNLNPNPNTKPKTLAMQNLSSSTGSDIHFVEVKLCSEAFNSCSISKYSVPVHVLVAPPFWLLGRSAALQ